jgi:hypothetical protein
VRTKGGCAWVAVEPLSVFKDDYGSAIGSELGRTQRLIPNIEKLTQREVLLRGGLHVNDAVGGVGVQPVEAVVEPDVVEDAGAVVLHELGLRDTDTCREA